MSKLDQILRIVLDTQKRIENINKSLISIENMQESILQRMDEIVTFRKEQTS